jgi:hypothetical protein
MSAIKKIFFTSLFVLVLTLLFWGVYNLSFPKKTAPETKKEVIKEEVIKPEEISKITAITDEAVSSPIVTPEDMLRYHSKSTGKAWATDLDGKNKKPLSGDEEPGLVTAIWSKDGEKSVIQSLSGEETKFTYQNYKNNQKVSLKKNLDQVAWQESGNRIFYKYYSPDTKERSLNVADPDGTNWKKLADLNYKNVSIAEVPKTSLVSFWNKGDSFTSTTLETIPIIGGEKKTIFEDRYGTDYLWGNTGNRVLVSNVDSKGGSKMQLGVMNSDGGEYRNLNFATFASKCSWSKNDKFIFCALPGGITGSAVLPNEYQEGKISTIDTFWKINVQNGEMNRIVETADITQKFDASDLCLNSDESYLFFINKIDSKLYRINL